MKIHRNIVLGIAALALAGFLEGTAVAQRAIAKDAHFTLRWKAMWADTILSPGDYTLSVVKVSSGSDQAYRVRFAGAGINKTLLVVRRQGPDVANSSMLVGESRGGICIIRELHLPYEGLVLTFPESKANRTLLAKAPKTLQSVPILLAAKQHVGGISYAAEINRVEVMPHYGPQSRAVVVHAKPRHSLMVCERLGSCERIN